MDFFLLCVAHELRAWLLHYSTAVLHSVLPEDYYQHHLLIVEAYNTTICSQGGVAITAKIQSFHNLITISHVYYIYVTSM